MWGGGRSQVPMALTALEQVKGVEVLPAEDRARLQQALDARGPAAPSAAEAPAVKRSRTVEASPAVLDTPDPERARLEAYSVSTLRAMLQYAQTGLTRATLQGGADGRAGCGAAFAWRG